MDWSQEGGAVGGGMQKCKITSMSRSHVRNIEFLSTLPRKRIISE